MIQFLKQHNYKSNKGLEGEPVYKFWAQWFELTYLIFAVIILSCGAVYLYKKMEIFLYLSAVWLIGMMSLWFFAGKLDRLETEEEENWAITNYFLNHLDELQEFFSLIVLDSTIAVELKDKSEMQLIIKSSYVPKDFHKYLHNYLNRYWIEVNYKN